MSPLGVCLFFVGWTVVACIAGPLLGRRLRRNNGGGPR